MCSICYSGVGAGSGGGEGDLFNSIFGPEWVQPTVGTVVGTTLGRSIVGRAHGQQGLTNSTRVSDFGLKKNFASHKTLASQKNLWKKKQYKYNCKHKNTHFPILSRVA